MERGASRSIITSWKTPSGPRLWAKKNWLFIGAKEAGQKSAVIYSIIESCRRRGIEPYDYLKDVLTRLPSMTNWQIAEVTPGAWARARQVKARVVS